MLYGLGFGRVNETDSPESKNKIYLKRCDPGVIFENMISDRKSNFARLIIVQAGGLSRNNASEKICVEGEMQGMDLDLGHNSAKVMQRG